MEDYEKTYGIVTTGKVEEYEKEYEKQLAAHTKPREVEEGPPAEEQTAQLLPQHDEDATNLALYEAQTEEPRVKKVGSTEEEATANVKDDTWALQAPPVWRRPLTST